MKTIKATITTELITSDDGKHTYEVIKRLEGVDGEKGCLIKINSFGFINVILRIKNHLWC